MFSLGVQMKLGYSDFFQVGTFPAELEQVV